MPDVSHVKVMRERLQAGRTELIRDGERRKRQLRTDVRRIDAALKALGSGPRGRPRKAT
jgi:hypothetical protein